MRRWPGILGCGEAGDAGVGSGVTCDTGPATGAGKGNGASDAGEAPQEIRSGKTRDTGSTTRKTRCREALSARATADSTGGGDARDTNAGTDRWRIVEDSSTPKYIAAQRSRKECSRRKGNRTELCKLQQVVPKSTPQELSSARAPARPTIIDPGQY